MPEGFSPALRQMSDAVLAVASNLEIEQVLQRLVDVSRGLVHARYAAIGIPNGEGGFAQFLTSGMDEKLVERLGPLPETHGLLGAMLEGFDSYRTGDIQQHPRFRGWWPSGHPDMRSFLGVPICAAGEVIGAFYLTDKEGADEFSEADQELIELLAAHAAIAVTNARLYERSRELSILGERNRLALELHDAVSQKLFALSLTAESAGTLLSGVGSTEPPGSEGAGFAGAGAGVDVDLEAAREQVERLRVLAQDVLDELRYLILELRPPELDRDGLATTLRKHVEVLRRVQGGVPEVELELDGIPPAEGGRDRELLRIAQEALQNAIRHSGATRIVLRLSGDDGRLVLEVRDDGCGFDPQATAVRSRRLGLSSMEERARRLGGSLAIDSTVGAGTTVRLEAPLG
jgi:signal transduction histidine kinase